MEREEAVEEAWRLAIDAVQNGYFTLKSGQRVTLTDRDLLRHLQWLATVQKVKPKGFPIPKDSYVRATGEKE